MVEVFATSACIDAGSKSKLSFEEAAKLSPDLEKKHERFVELRDAVRSM